MIDFETLSSCPALEKLRDRTFIFGVGAQRSGTTWLASYLSAHPDVAMSSMKELQYFNAMTLPDRFPELDARYSNLLLQKLRNMADGGKITRHALRRLMPLAHRVAMAHDSSKYFQYFALRIGSKLAFGEITPEYAFLTTETLQNIQRLNLNIKIVYLIRNPVDRYLSAISYFGRQRAAFDFEQASVTFLERKNFVEHTQYHLAIKRYLDVFGADRFLWLFYEDLFSEQSHADTCGRICSHLNIATLTAPLGQKVNSAGSHAVSDETRKMVAHRFADVYRAVLEIAGGVVPQKWQSEMQFAGL